MPWTAQVQPYTECTAQAQPRLGQQSEVKQAPLLDADRQACLDANLANLMHTHTTCCTQKRAPHTETRPAHCGLAAVNNNLQHVRALAARCALPPPPLLSQPLLLLHVRTAGVSIVLCAHACTCITTCSAHDGAARSCGISAPCRQLLCLRTAKRCALPRLCYALKSSRVWIRA
jgi:hypothetical protein